MWTLKTVSSDYPSNEDFSFEKALKESSEKEKCLQHIKTRKQRWKCECVNQKCCVNVNFFSQSDQLRNQVLKRSSWNIGQKNLTGSETEAATGGVL